MSLVKKLIPPVGQLYGVVVSRCLLPERVLWAEIFGRRYSGCFGGQLARVGEILECGRES